MILDLAKENWYADGVCRNADANLFFQKEELVHEVPKHYAELVLL